MLVRRRALPSTLLLALAIPWVPVRAQDAPDLDVVPLTDQAVMVRLDGRQPTNLIGIN